MAWLRGIQIRCIEPRQPVHDLHGLQTDGDDALEEFEGIAGVGHGFGCPEVGVVDDAAVRLLALMATGQANPRAAISS
jgi:hypothetical protein